MRVGILDLKQKKVFQKVKLRNLQRKYNRLPHDSVEAVQVFEEIQKVKSKL